MNFFSEDVAHEGYTSPLPNTPADPKAHLERLAVPSLVRDCLHTDKEDSSIRAELLKTSLEAPSLYRNLISNVRQ